MKKILVYISMIMLLITPGCSDFGGLHSSSAPSESDFSGLSDQQPDVFTGSGSIGYESEEDLLLPEQEQLILSFMNLYYESLATLTVYDPADLFSETSTAQLLSNRTVWEYLVNLRRMQQTDLTLDSYRYEMTCLSVTSREDGALRVRFREDSVQNFSAHPQVDSENYDVWHMFTMEETESGWKLTQHMDSVIWSILDYDEDYEWSSQENYYADLLLDLTASVQGYTQQRLIDTDINSIPSFDHSYDRQAAVSYAHEWADGRNEQWPDYSNYGGNCQNYVSQCLLAGGIPMDTEGPNVWKWYGSTPNDRANRVGRSSSWSSVNYFLDYVEANSGEGLVAQAFAPYYSGQPGDILQFGTTESYRHTVIIVDTVEDESGQTVDYLINSNTANMRNFPASAYPYANQMLIRIFGWND